MNGMSCLDDVKFIGIDTMQIDELLDYKEDGTLVWNRRIGLYIRKGQKAGCVQSGGYIRIKFKNKSYAAHRVVWRKHNGKIPKGMVIDHINGDRTDNRVENLRCVTQQENTWNRKDVRGYTYVNGVYVAYITVDGIRKHLGTFTHPIEAKMAYKQAKKTYHKIGG